MHSRRVGYLPERFREMAWDDRDVKPIRDVAEVTFTGISKNFKESFRHLECYVTKSMGNSLTPALTSPAANKKIYINLNTGNLYIGHNRSSLN